MALARPLAAGVALAAVTALIGRKVNDAAMRHDVPTRPARPRRPFPQEPVPPDPVEPRWSETDEALAETFPASDAVANY